MMATCSGRASNEEKLRGLYELSPLGIALTDMQGHYLEFNSAFTAICGYPTDELKALDYWTLTPKRYADDEQRRPLVRVDDLVDQVELTRTIVAVEIVF